MTKIVLEVDDTTGKVYEGLSQESKTRFNQTVNLMIKKAVNDATFADYSRLMDDNGSEALKNARWSGFIIPDHISVDL